MVMMCLFFQTLSFATTYTMGTTGSQSATVTATSASPDKFYDNGGSGSNYSSSVSATYTFNCAAGSYLRIKINTLVTESGIDLFYVYDGTNTSARLTGEQTFSGTASAGYMYVATSGSLTVKFTSDGSLNYAGWNADVWIASSPGQIWDGSTSTEITTATNWEGDVLPYDGFTSIYVPSGLTNYPILSDASSQQMSFYDFRIPAAATYYFSSGTNVMSIYGNCIVDGTFNKTSSLYVNFEGGNSGNYATISGTGDYTTISIGVGLNRISYYKILNSLLIKSFMLNNDIGASYFDMNTYDLRTLSFTVESGTTFYQRTGLLKIEGSTISIDDTGFIEATGTTFFTPGLDWTALNQTIPSISYYNLQIRTNNGYTETIGSGSTVTVLNDLTISNPSTAGGIVTNVNDITVAGNFYLGATGNALTLNIANRIYRASGSGVFTMGNIIAHAINNTYTSSTNYVISGFDAVPTFYGTFTYNSGSAQKVIPANYYNLTTNGTGTKTMYGNIDVNNDITLSNGSLVQGTYTINIGRNWTSTGNYYVEGTGNVTFDETNNATITGASASIGASTGVSLASESFENAGSIPSGWASSTIVSSGTAPSLTYVSSNSNPTVSAASNGTYMVKFNSYTCGSSSQIRLSKTSSFSTTGYTNITVNFDWYKDNGYSSSNDYVNVQYSTNGSTWTTTGSAIYRYSATNGWTAQSVTLPVGAENQGTLYIALLFTSAYGNNCSFDNLRITGDYTGETYTGEAFNKVIISKTGSATVTLGSKVMIQTSQTFTNGIENTTASYFLEFDEDATAATASDASHVNGYVAKRTNTTTKFTFPIGDATTYRECAITPTNTNSTTWTSKYFGTAYSDLSTIDVSNVSTVEYWTIDRSGTTPSNSTIELSWNSNSNMGSNYATALVAHYNGADWESAGGNNITGNATSGTINSNANWGSYSPFTLSQPSVPLPITLLSFKAKQINQDVKLIWETATEINNDYFTIEKSTDGYQFTSIGQIDGAGNSNTKISYNLIDNRTFNGVNYYRLIQTDFNGKETITPIISIDLSRNNLILIKTVNSLGQEVTENYKGIIFEIYSDGSSIQKFNN